MEMTLTNSATQPGRSSSITLILSMLAQENQSVKNAMQGE